MEKILSLVFSVLILVNAFCVRSIARTWLSPACMFSLFWFCMTFIPLVVLFTIPVNPLAILFILACTVSFSFSVFMFKWDVALAMNKNKNNLSHDYFNNKYLETTFLVLSVLAVLSILLHTFGQGITLNDLLSNPFKTVGTYVNLRYSENLERSFFSRFSLTLNYVCVCLGGILLNSKISKARQLYLVVLSFLPSLLIMAIQSSKGAFFLSCAFFYGGVLVRRVFRNDLRLITKETLGVVLLSFLIVVPLVIFSFLARGMSDQHIGYVSWKLTSYLLSYSFAHLYAFSDWFAWYIGHQSYYVYTLLEPSLGFYTFMAWFQFFGDSRFVPAGVFDEYFQYGTFLKSNIYSFYRPLVIDFTIPGAIIFFYLLGVFFNGTFYVMLKCKKPILTVIVFLVFTGFVYQSFVISLFMYRTTYTMFVLLYLVLLFNNYRYNNSTSGVVA